MADFKYRIEYTYERDGRTARYSTGEIEVSSASAYFRTGKQSVPVTMTPLPVDDPGGDLGLAVIRNLDATNFVGLYAKDGATETLIMKIFPGQAVIVDLGEQLSGVTEYCALQADTAPCIVEYSLFPVAT